MTSLETAPLSDAQGESFVFSSGSAATAAIAHWVTLAKKEGGAGGADGNGGGGHILAVNDVVSNCTAGCSWPVDQQTQYGGTARYFSRVARSTGLDITYLDMIEAGEEGIRAAIRPDTRVGES